MAAREQPSRTGEVSGLGPPRRGRLVWWPIAVAVVGLGLATAGARCGYRASRADPTLPLAFRYFSHGDAERYEEIVDAGYVYHQPTDPAPVLQASWMKPPGAGRDRLKNVVWYPLYPLLGLAVKKLTGLSTAVSLNIVTDVALLLGGLLFYLMARRHYAGRWSVPGTRATTGVRLPWLSPPDEAALWSTLLLWWGPAAIFLYANFTESLFVVLLAAFLDCLQRRRWWRAAAIAGLASSSRGQGVLLGPVLALSYLVHSDQRSVAARLGVAAVLGLVAAAGLIGYMAYQQARFGDPLAFVHAQHTWNVGIHKATLLHALNPLNAVANFLRLTFHRPPGWGFDGPMAWEGACVLWPPVVLAVWGRRYLSWEQQMLGWMLWGLPYVSSGLAGYPLGVMKWMSMGRFMAAALPLHLALGGVLVRARWLGLILVAASVIAFVIFAYRAGAGAWLG